MRLINKRNAAMIFYCLMAADGEITEEEIKCFEKTGNELDSEHFNKYRDSIPDEFSINMKSVIDEDDYYDVVSECADKALASEAADAENAISSRALIWNMLVIAMCNGEYAKDEIRLIKHMVRVLGIEKSVFLEMEQLIHTAAETDKELEWIKNSDKPYKEVAEIVCELEKRSENIIVCAENLVEDELYSAVEKAAVPEKDFIDNAKETISNNVIPAVAEFGKQTGKFFGDAFSKIGDVFSKNKNTETADSKESE